MKVLCIAAHPDDAEMGMGGTIAKHAETEDEIHILTCTLGGVHGDPATRMKEAQQGARTLGVREEMLHFLDYPITKLNKPSKEFTVVLNDFIAELSPERIYVHSPHDYHQVHVTIGRTLLKLAESENLRQLLCYEVNSSTSRDFKPDAFVDITEYIELKVQSVLAHKSQSARLYTQPNVVRSLCNIRYAREKVGTDPNGMAEAFSIAKYLI
jgi:LmbE family N-acetylglucosaminyl deacetylase